jgi:hypothetical protein
MALAFVGTVERLLMQLYANVEQYPDQGGDT